MNDTRLNKACKGATFTKGGMNVPELKTIIKTHVSSNLYPVINKARRKELQNMCDVYIGKGQPIVPKKTKQISKSVPLPKTFVKPISKNLIKYVRPNITRINISNNDFDKLYRLYEPIYYQHTILEKLGKTNSNLYTKLDHYISSFNQSYPELYVALTDIISNSPLNYNELALTPNSIDTIINDFANAVDTVYINNV